MKDSILEKLSSMADRYEEVSALLSTPDIINNQNKFRELSKEFSDLEPMVNCFRLFLQYREDLKTAEEMLKDPDMKDMAQEEISLNKEKLLEAEEELNIFLLPKDPDDDKNIFLEIRAGAGGDEAAIFSGDLFRMYTRYAEKLRWNVEVVSESEGEHGGYKEVVLRISGDSVYSKLKFESGAHRVQRVPKTESQGRIHTSACTVVVMAEADEVSEIEINSADLRVDTFRASGAGGQHVNKTDSAIRLTHLPTGVVVECQEERSQHKNRAKAMALLQSRLLNSQKEKQQAEISETRRNLVGTGDRSDRIRTYNFPQGRLTDHRINLTIYKLDEVIEGSLDQVIEPLVREYQADLLASVNG